MADNQDARAIQIEKHIDRGVTGALALKDGPHGTRPAPKNLTELMEVAKLMATTGATMRPLFRGNPGACLAIVMQAYDWGMQPFAVASKAYIVRSKSGDETMAFESQLIHALVNMRPELSRRLRPTYTGDGQQMMCSIAGYLKGEEDPFIYDSPTIGEIKVKNSPLWISDPPQQLFYYSTRAWARRYLPEAIMGVYAPDELDPNDGSLFQGPDNAKDVTPARPEARLVEAKPAELPGVELIIVIADALAPWEKTQFQTLADAVDRLHAVFLSAKAGSIIYNLDETWGANKLLREAALTGAEHLADKIDICWNILQAIDGWVPQQKAGVTVEAAAAGLFGSLLYDLERVISDRQLARFWDKCHNFQSQLDTADWAKLATAHGRMERKFEAQEAAHQADAKLEQSADEDQAEPEAEPQPSTDPELTGREALFASLCSDLTGLSGPAALNAAWDLCHGDKERLGAARWAELETYYLARKSEFATVE